MSTQPVLWAKVIDQSRCIGCHACTVACKAEHLVPVGVTRTYVKQVEVGRFPTVQRHFQVTRCNQCDDPPCVHICPTGAMFRRPDGIVDFDRSVCIGCKACMAACPYDAIYIDPVSRSAEKCNFCTHRIDAGLEPACVVVCPVEAIVVGPLNGEGSEIQEILGRGKVTVRKPEKGTRPKLFYVEAGEATLQPARAARPEIYAFAQNPASNVPWGDGEDAWKGAGAAGGVREVTTYEPPHKAPWGWMVSAYLWTKSLAAGAFLVGALPVWLGQGVSRGWELTAAALALAWLVVTGLLLVGDLTHPERFYLILLRPQWRSWLARGAAIITAYGGVLVAFLLARVWGWQPGLSALRLAGAVLAILTAVYTAFLFAQARGRDLWQDPLLALHLLVQAGLAGSAGLLLVALVWPAGDELRLLRDVLVGTAALHVLLAANGVMVPHATEDGSLAARAMYRGRFRLPFWLGVGGSLFPVVLWALGEVGAGGWPLAAGAALVGLLLYEHAYVQAGQSVPLR